MSLGIVIGWIVVVAFAATTVLTLLAVTKVIDIDDEYLQKLFPALILELIGAGFFLFYAEFSPPMLEFKPSLGDANYYLFDQHGEPLPETKLLFDGEVQQVFNRGELPGFVVRRDFELGDQDMQIRSRASAGFSLGVIPVNTLVSGAGNRLIPGEKQLELGLHYAECNGGGQPPCQNPRDGARAAAHLFAALGVTSHGQEHSDAALALFYLKQYFSSCEQFVDLARELEEHRAIPNRFKEIGDVYLAIASSLKLGESTRDARLSALDNYVRYVAAARVGPLYQQAEAEAKEIAQLYFPIGHKVRRLIDEGGRGNYKQALDLLGSQFDCPSSSESTAD